MSPFEKMTDKKLVKNSNDDDNDDDRPIKFTPRHFSFSFSKMSRPSSNSPSWSNSNSNSNNNSNTNINGNGNINNNNNNIGKKLLSLHYSSEVKDVYYYPYSASTSTSTSTSQQSTPSHRQQLQHQETKQTVNLGEIFWYIPHPIIPVNGDVLFVPTLNGVEISESLFAQQPFLYRGESIAIKLPIGLNGLNVVEYLDGPMLGYDFLNYIHHFYIINKRIIDQDFWNNNLLFSRIEIDGDCLKLVTSSLLE